MSHIYKLNMKLAAKFLINSSVGNCKSGDDFNSLEGKNGALEYKIQAILLELVPQPQDRN